MLSRNDEATNFSIFFKYDILVYLSFMITIYIFHRLKQKWDQEQNTNNLLTFREAKAIYSSEKRKPVDESKLGGTQDQEQNANSLLTIQSAFSEAKTIYSSEIRIPFSKSKLGGKFGLFSALRHNKLSKEAVIAEKALFICKDNAKAKNHIIKLLKDKGSLWDMWESENHSFNNYLLTCLRYHNINGYREIVGNIYGITFISGEITLYRRDSRYPSAIFKDGFRLREQSNTDSTRKIHYANPTTYSYGVSFSKKIPPSCYNHDTFGESYYTVYLPPDHDFLLIDITKSPRNQQNLTQHQRDLEEVNSMDDIPAAFVKSYISKYRATFLPKTNKDGVFIGQNENFAPTTQIRRQDRSFRGCY